MSVYLSPAAARFARLLARASAVAACAAFAAMAVQRGPPAPPDGPGLERDIQYLFVVFAIMATLVAFRWPGLGGALLAFAGSVLGVAAATRYSSETALLVALMFIGPGVLFLGLWASGRALFVQLAAAAFVVFIIAYGGNEAQTRHEDAFGPAHPESVLQPLPTDRVEWVWTGGVTSSSFEARAKIAYATEKVRLVVSTSPDLAPAVRSAYDPAGNGNRVAALRVAGLSPSTVYYYGVEVDGEIDAYQRGQIETFPDGPATFTIAFASCARSGSNGAVFDAMRASEPLLYIEAGDLHYENIDTNDRAKFRTAYDRVLTSPAQSALYRNVPIAYMWDDHDFGGNNSDSSSRSKQAARLSYRENVPHYDLPAGDGNDAIYQAFDIGRARVIITDTRSERGAEPAAGGKGRSMLGSGQLAWLKQELATASRTHSLVIWVNPDPWISAGDPDGDDWGGFAFERADIADFVARNGIRNLVMLSGDAHMIAADDGSNSGYSTSGAPGFPVFQAGALDRPGSEKGGPYSEGAFPGAGQFGLLTVEDDGASPVRVTFQGLDYSGRQVLRYSFTVPGPVASAP